MSIWSSHVSSTLGTDESPGYVCIVTPVFNGETYIDETIASVVFQAGNFVLHYHLQDGGSTDLTRSKIERWIALHRAGNLPTLCRRLILTSDSSSDRGMYDALNKGFSGVLPKDPDAVMGWIAADDKIAPGAFTTILSIRKQFPNTRWFGGRVSLLDEGGSITGVEPMRAISQVCLAAGLHDGRAMPFIMQEATFWCVDLWRKVNGIDSNFRLAGDWDLWRRIANYAAYVSIDTVLGFHRRRPGQLSENMRKYYAEVDDKLAETAACSLAEDSNVEGVKQSLRDKYQQTSESYERLRMDPTAFRSSPHASTAIRFDLGTKRWEQIEGFGSPASSLSVHSETHTTEIYAVFPKVGLDKSEGPLPEYNIPNQFRWMREPTAVGEVVLKKAGRYIVRICCRSWTSNQVASITANGRTLAEIPIVASGHERDIELRASGVFDAGLSEVGLSIRQGKDDGKRLLMIRWELEYAPEPDRAKVVPVSAQVEPISVLIGSPTFRREWPRISIVVPTRNQSQFLPDTLNSILRQGYPNLDLIVVDGGSSDETNIVMRQYSKFCTHFISEPDSGQSEAINKGFRLSSGEILTWLNSDDLLADGALHAVALKFEIAGVDIVAGMCEVFDAGNAVVSRHLPCLLTNTLDPLDLLDLDNKWLRGKFFHQPEVFFKRAIWERAGSRVDETLYYSMDYDLWVRMAKQRATIAVIGYPLALFRQHPAQKTHTVGAYLPELRKHANRLRQDMEIAAFPTALPLKPRLKIVLFNDYGFKYGAGLAHGRLAAALTLLGHEVSALAYANFDLGRPAHMPTADEVAAIVAAERPDLVLLGNLHSISADFDLIGALLKHNLRFIFYAHDHWIATGRCGYPGQCARYKSGCDEQCPTANMYPALPPDQVGPSFRRRRSSLEKAMQAGRSLILTNSGYMREKLTGEFGGSAHPPIYAAPLGIDTAVFKPGSRWRARNLLGLSQRDFIVCAVAASFDDDRKGLPVLLKALDQLSEIENVTLILVGFATKKVEVDCKVVVTGYLDREELLALYYQASDVFVGPSLQEAFGQTYIEAGACAIPSIAFAIGGVCEAVLDGITGRLVKEVDASSLAGAIQNLRVDPSLRLRMGQQALLHAKSNFSLEASAVRLQAILSEDPLLNTQLAPNASLAVEPHIPSVTYLSTDPSPSYSPAPDWFALVGLSLEVGRNRQNGYPEVFWWAAPSCSILVRASQDGDHVIRILGRNDHAEQTVCISVNGLDLQYFNVPRRPLAFNHLLHVCARLVSGLNRVDFSFARSAPDTSNNRSLAYMVEDVDLWDSQPSLAGDLPDGTFEFVDGFSASEGPHPDRDLPRTFRWALGHQSNLRLYSAIAGVRQFTIKVRNVHSDQYLTVKIGKHVVGARELQERELTKLLAITFEAEFVRGYHPVTIEAVHASFDSGGRELSFILENIEFSTGGGNTLHSDLIRWDMSKGVGLPEAPIPEMMLFSPFRWFDKHDVALTINKTTAGLTRIDMVCRAAVPDQSALIEVNGTKLRSLKFPLTDFTLSNVVSFAAPLRSGHNVLNFQFAKAARPAGDERQLCLLIESISMKGISDVEALELENEHTDDLPETVGSAVCISGLGEIEGPFPEMGLDSEFRWATDSRAALSLVSDIQGMRRVNIAIRSVLSQQTISVEDGDGTELVNAELSGDLRELVTLSFDKNFGGDSADIFIKATRGAKEIGGEERTLFFILQSVYLDGES